jgi:hypothetical protein
VYQRYQARPQLIVDEADDILRNACFVAMFLRIVADAERLAFSADVLITRAGVDVDSLRTTREAGRPSLARTLNL